jgi:hypothetical protein
VVAWLDISGKDGGVLPALVPRHLPDQPVHRPGELVVGLLEGRVIAAGYLGEQPGELLPPSRWPGVVQPLRR